MRVNVKQPDGNNAIFDTITDSFLEFNADIRENAETYEWISALSMAIGAKMCITEDIYKAIDLGLTSKVECEELLKENIDED